MLIDTHCHLTHSDLAPQIDAVLERARAAGVSRAVVVSETADDARAALALMGARRELYLAAGIHPHRAAQAGAEQRTALAELHRDADTVAPGRIVAVGETGLDFCYDFAPPPQQEDLFRFHLELACEVNRPLVIHARRAEGVVCDILEGYPQLAGRFVFHCFSGGPELARRILDLGGRLSFTGVVTFKNAGEIADAARMTPDDRILVETDAPFLSPEPVRRQRPCEPAFVAHTARFLAALRGERFESFAAKTTVNAERFFNLAEV